MDEPANKPQLGALPQGSREDLEAWGVVIRDTGTAKWTDAELTSVRDSYSKAPDKKLLEDLVIVREKENSKATFTEAETHGPRAKCKIPPTSKIHTHFYDGAFSQQPDGQWKIATAMRVPVHELGHVLVERRLVIDPPVLDVVRTFDAAYDAVKNTQGMPTGFLDCAAKTFTAFTQMSTATTAYAFVDQGGDLNQMAKDRKKLLDVVRESKAVLDTTGEFLEKHLTYIYSSAPETTRTPAYDLSMALYKATKSFRDYVYGWRIYDCFIAAARDDDFAPFSDNSEKDAEEWFAETYALFALEPAKVPSNLDAWLTKRCPVPKNIDDD